MFEELKKIELSGKEYPIKCDLIVLEKIQEEFGSLDAFERGIITWEPELDAAGEKVKDKSGNVVTHFKMPDMRAVNTALYLMANEGEEITAEKERRAPVRMSRNEFVRKADVNPTSLALQLHEEFYRCFSTKNVETTKN